MLIASAGIGTHHDEYAEGCHEGCQEGCHGRSR
jgi:hypothetical protein